jgi:kumamolisin
MAMTDVPRSGRHQPSAAVIVGVMVVALVGMLAWSGPRVGAPAVSVLVSPTSAPLDDGDGVVLGATAAATPVRFSLVLHQPGVAALERFLAGLQDPASPDYHRYLDAATYGREFGLPDADLAALDGWVRAADLTPVRTFAQRTQMIVTGSAGRVEAAFGVHLVDVRDGASGVVYHRPAGQPTLPAAIARLVDGVADLGNRPPRAAPGVSRAIPGGAARPVDLAAAYDIGPLYDAGLRGDGIFVAVVSFCAHLARDIDAYEQEYRLDDPPTGDAVVNVAVGVPDCSERLEPSGDIEIVRAIAPHANVLNFESTYSDSQADVINAIVEDGRATIVTDSYGWCYDHVSAADRAAGLKALEAAQGHGISIFVASGDWGAYDCYNSSKREHQLSVDWPSSTVYTVAVGGTQLSVRTDSAYYGEAAWQDYLSVGGSGGGLNPVEDRPSWQHGPGVDNGFSNGKRQVPDVAAAADVASPYSIYYTPEGSTKGSLRSAWGTSFASPFWAGVTALLQQHVVAEKLRWPGFINPMLYDLAAETPPNGAFHDITRGNNLYFDATSGWDYATGLGSTDVAALDAAVMRYLSP